MPAACAPSAHPEGFSVNASKTVAVPVDRLYEAFAARKRTATKPKTARFDWGDGETRVNVTFAAKGEAKSTAALEHARLVNAEEAERMKAFWRDRIASLKEMLER